MSGITTTLARDALCELVSIGSGNALTSLNRMLGRGSISLSLPELVCGEAAVGLDDLDRQGCVVHLAIQGAIRCTFLALFDEVSAQRLASLLLNRADGEGIGALEESALLEAVNIISCSFLGALGTMIRGELIPSPPEAAYGRLADVLHDHLAIEHDTIVLTTSFADAGNGFAGRILVIAAEQWALSMLQAVGVH